MAKHTPGPWHRNIKPASRYPVIFSGRNKHVVTAVPAQNIPDDEAEANHNLLVAAPAMLAALCAIAEELERGAEFAGPLILPDVITARQRALLAIENATREI